MRAPEFWDSPAGVRARALAPLGAVYGAVARARMARAAPRADLPTIAIGGLTLGGDGKTPTALALAERLAALGERPAFLTRGYGRTRRAPEPLVVDPARHRARDVGDEALLLAGLAETIVGVDRSAAARLAKGRGASVLLLDDGLHSRRLEPDLAVLVVDAAYGAGNGFCPPAGPLRAPLAAQFARADVVVAIGEGAGLTSLATKRALKARLAPDPAVAARLAGKRIFAFAGIGRPQKFARTLGEIGAEIAGFRWFPDHYAYTPDDLAALARDAKRAGAVLVTTPKDAARIGPNAIETMPIALAFESPGAVNALLLEFLSLARAERGLRQP